MYLFSILLCLLHSNMRINYIYKKKEKKIVKEKKEKDAVAEGRG